MDNLQHGHYAHEAQDYLNITQKLKSWLRCSFNHHKVIIHFYHQGFILRKHPLAMKQHKYSPSLYIAQQFVLFCF